MNAICTIEIGEIANLILQDKLRLQKTLDSYKKEAKSRNNLIALAIRYLEKLIIKK